MNSAGFATFFNQMRCVFISFDLNPLTLATAKCEPQNSSTQTQPTPENEPTSSLTAKQECYDKARIFHFSTFIYHVYYYSRSHDRRVFSFRT
jgi:hypothetical protein